MLHLFGREQYLIFFQFAADHRHLRHAARGEQARAYLPVGEGAEVAKRRAVGGERHEHQFAENARLRPDGGRAGLCGQLFLYEGDFLRHGLPRPINLHAPVKLYPHDRETCGGGRAHAPYARRAVHRRFEREGDEPFHFLGCHAFCLGHHHDGGRVEVGKHVDFHRPGRVKACDDEQRRAEEHGKAVAQRKRDYFVKHGFLEQSI